MNTKTSTKQTPSAAADKTAHTPGPWQVSRWSQGMAGAWIALGNGKQVAHTAGQGSFAKNEDDANARLIAAAPEMLAALKVIERSLSAGSSVLDYPSLDALSAIAKAEGSAQ